ncbi:murein biosynthesis integral membrane protein MurJ [Microbacterium azadirachtae]|uniref:Putative peptidoglycan biosynthesis protein MviN n=1 Tax=Microbacterium azadirachtae TaxID=582680 RepID=A0A0F0KW53_9MICO|nr:murein biosynthesis integral membrane protein MurJ [Microbacterium azadirachtae]KJL25123.1 putative peptidoglycan biosynthesis protein MviN [Microbacterium azadirachtae]UXW85947.1 murein biosynthesis integral membrane protein MurJ [Microbacterium azadirachtae]
MNSLGRASALLAAGTMVSRITGLLRTIVLVGVIGAIGSAPDAFAIANQLPNDVFSLISVGVLTAVLVPQIVKAVAGADGGSAFISKIFTAGTVVLVAATVVATLATPWLVSLIISPDVSEAQRALAIAFGYWCMPQILFYGLYALIGETLNARRIFGPFTWAPVVNNIISIAGFLVIGAMFGTPLTEITDWTPERIAWLGGTATFGIVLQAAVLLAFWPRTRLALRIDFRWRGVGLGNIVRLAGWTMLMALSSLAAGFYQHRIAIEASGHDPSITVMNNAWLIFMLPYSVIVLSIGTPYFTQLSEHAHAGRIAEVRADIARSIRTLGFFLVGALAAVLAAAVPASRIFTDDRHEAQMAAPVLVGYLVALVPLAVLFIVQRTFYALGDTRTPFFFTIFQCVLIVATAFGAQLLHQAGVVPLSLLAATIALGQSLSSILQTIVASVLLSRRLHGIGAREWILALLRFLAAAIPAAAAGWGVFLLLGGAKGWTTADRIPAALGCAIVASVVLIVYIGILALLRAPELDALKSLVRRVVPSR